MNEVRLIAITKPVISECAGSEDLIAFCARVSNPGNQANSETAPRLLAYLMRNHHWSPFEMASMTIEINTTRDIARQILRHRSFSFQEFCVAGSTKITLELPNGQKRGKRSSYSRTIEHLYSLQKRGLKMPSAVRVFDVLSRTFVTAKIREVFQTGLKPVFRVTLANGKSVDCTKEHKFLAREGFISIEDAVGIRLLGQKAVMTKSGVDLACNGVPAYRDREWLAASKSRCIASGEGLAGIAAEAGVTTHTIRKALKQHGLQFTKLEVSSYTPIWNKGLTGYSLPRHTPETISKMRASAKRGPESNLWRGGADRSERLKIADWCSANRTEFLRSADYKCNRCESNEKLELHHIQTVADRPDLAYEKSNIEVLCHGCHRKHHGLSGEAKQWRERSRGNTLTIHWSTVTKVEYLGEQMTYDMEVEHESHNYVANGIVTHNSQRYAVVQDEPVEREARLQDHKNRQNSISTEDIGLQDWWFDIQHQVAHTAQVAYDLALKRGLAKEVARAVLPEGLTPSRLYMAGTIRSFIHYVLLRRENGTQAEHREIAEQVQEILLEQFPALKPALTE